MRQKPPPSPVVDWWSYKCRLRLRRESRSRPSPRFARSDEFSSAGHSAAEIDFLDTIYGLIRGEKPTTLLETGTGTGISTAAMAFALAENSRFATQNSHLYTIEINAAAAGRARSRLASLKLERFVTGRVGNSLAAIEGDFHGLQFDFVFFDSTRKVRFQELCALRSRRLLKSNCLLVFHDTSPGWLGKDCEGYITDYLRSIRSLERECKERLHFPQSRGLFVCRL
jgi:predicted O-methyltransferase YrrM